MADNDDKDIAARITVRIDKEMRDALIEMRKEYFERTGVKLEDARLVRMLLRRAVGNDMDRAAVSEALSLTYRLNQLVVGKLIHDMERNAEALVAEAKQTVEGE